MVIGVSKWSGKVGITSLTSGSPAPIPLPTSNYLHLPLHESGSTTALTVNLGNIGPSECKVGGTLTSTWSVSGEVTLGTDNYINYGSSVGQIQPHVDFSTLGDGGLLLLWRLKVPDILTNKPFFSASPLGTSTGGWEILVNSAESLRFGHRPVGVGSTSFQAMESLTIGSYHNIMVYVDPSNALLYWSKDGATKSSAAIPGGAPYAQTNPLGYFRSGGLSDGNDPPSGGHGTPDFAMRDVWILRVSTSLVSQLDDISQDYHANYYEPRLRSLSNI